MTGAVVVAFFIWLVFCYATTRPWAHQERTVLDLGGVLTVTLFIIAAAVFVFCAAV